MQGVDIIFYLVILILSIIIHEIAHGYMAEYFGDPTARLEGRLTLNPIKHIDPFGSIILPFILTILKAPFLLGWAKPVPYNPANLNNKKLGTIAVASAGILSNFALALIFGLILRFSKNLNLNENFYFIVSIIVIINLALGIFNLIPIPPLDGSKIIFELLPPRFYHFEELLNTYGFIILILFIIYLPGFLYAILSFLFNLIVGHPLPS